MMNLRGTAEMGLLKAFVLAVSIATVAHAGMAYLPKTGPMPLRMGVVKSPPPPDAELLAMNSAKTSAAPDPLPVPPLVTTDTNPPIAKAVMADLVSALPPVTMGAGNALDGTLGQAVFTLPTPELMGLTPQMLALYFHPTGNGTNAALVGPFHVGFVPPLLPMEKSSHAEYIVK